METETSFCIEFKLSHMLVTNYEYKTTVSWNKKQFILSYEFNIERIPLVETYE